MSLMQGEQEKLLKAYRKFCLRARIEVRASGWYAYDPAYPEVQQDLEQLVSLKQKPGEQKNPYRKLPS